MANFKVGQKVVCVKKFVGLYLFSKTPTIGEQPIKGETYTVDAITMRCGEYCLFLKEFTHNNIGGKRVSFVMYKFRPIQYQSATAEILEKFKLTEEKSDVKVKEVETV